jgi:hypothetical protein
LCIALVGLTVVAYVPLWSNEFVDYDDDVYITRNPRVLEGLTWSGIRWAWTNDEAPYWLPVTWMSFQFDAQFFSTRTSEGKVLPSPEAFHCQNLFWHAAGVLLLFALFCRLTGACWCSFLVAALFAVHPMHVESVAWAIERKDVLSGFFGILTLWAYVRYVEKPRWTWYVAMSFAFLLSLLSKPMLITLPFVLLLVDLWPLRRWGRASHARDETVTPVRKQVPFRRLVVEKLPLFVLAGAIAVVTTALREQHGAIVPLAVISLSARLGNALTAYGWYLSRTFWPVGLTVLYPHPRENWSVLHACAGAGLLSVVTALCLWQARQRPWLIAGWLWFVGSLLPVIGLAQGGAQAWADRFCYWPHIGLFFAIVWGLAELVARVRVPALVSATVGALVLAVLLRMTWVQVGYWQNGVTLWEHTVDMTDDNDRAHEHLSACYRGQGRLDEADFHLAEACRIQLKRIRGE